MMSDMTFAETDKPNITEGKKMFQMLPKLEHQEFLVHAFSILLPCFLFIFVNKSWKRKQRLPPSPPKLPIIGNFHQLGLIPHRTLLTLAQHYGPLMLLHFCGKPTLVVSSADMAREIMKTHDLIFSSRPNLSIPRRLFYNNKDLAFAPYGEYWRQTRRMCVLQLLSSKRVQSFRSVREEEVALMIEKIRRSCLLSPSSSALVDLSEILGSLTNDIICRVALGRKYGGDVEGRKFVEMIREFAALVGVFNVGDYIPWLSWVNYVSGLDARVQKNFKDLDGFLDQVIEDHIKMKREKDEGGCATDGDSKDFVDFLFGIQKDGSAGISLERDHIKAIILDMFAAGTETTHTALEWEMVELLRQPELMEEVQDEVRKIAKGKTNITEDDLEQMHYMKSVIKESLRLHPPLPLLVPRESTEEVKIQGYDIPAKTTVIINAFAIGRDPRCWEEAEQFQPKRFLNGTSSVDFKGHDFEFIPFGAGRRGCPGNQFATFVNELALANILHNFDWALPDGLSGNDLDMTECSGITAHLKSPLLAIATPHHCR